MPREYQAAISDEEQNQISLIGTYRVLEIIEAYKIKVTFFITAKFAQNNLALLSRMLAGGHEIASHGLEHWNFQRDDLTKSREILSELCQHEIVGFRMPRLASIDKEDILSAGYKYESSLNPVWLPGRYNNRKFPLDPFKETCGLWQFPISAFSYLRIPLFWLSFKTFPQFFYNFGVKLTLRRANIFNFYTHPWEYNAESADKKWKIPAYITNGAGEQQCARLQRLIEWLKIKHHFVTFTTMLNEMTKTEKVAI